MSWYLAVLQNYVGFGGRARRREYWYFVLFNMVAITVLIWVDNLLALANAYGVGPLYVTYVLAVTIPQLAVTFRRLHDTDRSAWWLFILLIPLVGEIVILIFLCQAGTEGANRFGADPKTM